MYLNSTPYILSLVHNVKSPINKISFKITQPIMESDFETVEIYIDRKPLIELIRKVELPFAKKEGSKLIAGGYMGLSPNEVFLPSRLFFGKPEFYEYQDGKVSILECSGCGMAGCWPFLVKISVDDKFVTWSDYEQPNRGENHSVQHWQYDELPSFRFDKTQYEKALLKDPRYFGVSRT